MKILPVITVLAVSLTGCGVSPLDDEESVRDQAQLEIHSLEENAAAELGITAPVDFADLLSYPVWCSCWSRRGVLVDSTGAETDFNVRSTLCPPGTSGLQWNCNSGCDDNLNDFVPQPEKNRAVGVLLGVWLAREFSADEIASLPDFDDRCHSPFERVNRASYILHIRTDPALVDLPLILALNGT